MPIYKEGNEIFLRYCEVLLDHLIPKSSYDSKNLKEWVNKTINSHFSVDSNLKIWEIFFEKICSISLHKFNYLKPSTEFFTLLKKKKSLELKNCTRKFETLENTTLKLEKISKDLANDTIKLAEIEELEESLKDYSEEFIYMGDFYLYFTKEELMKKVENFKSCFNELQTYQSLFNWIRSHNCNHCEHLLQRATSYMGKTLSPTLEELRNFIKESENALLELSKDSKELVLYFSNLQNPSILFSYYVEQEVDKIQKQENIKLRNRNRNLNEGRESEDIFENRILLNLSHINTALIKTREKLDSVLNNNNLTIGILIHIFISIYLI